MEYTEYDDETLKHLQQTELMILKDFISICEENNPDYYIYGGSLIGLFDMRDLYLGMMIRMS